MNSLEKSFKKLSKKEIEYLLETLTDHICAWYNGDLTGRDRRNFLKAINFLLRLFPKPKYKITNAYRAFQNKRELIRKGTKGNLSNLTKPCASFSKDIEGLFSFIEGNGNEDNDTYIVNVNLRDKDILIDTDTIIKYLKKLIQFFKTTKNKEFIDTAISSYGPGTLGEIRLSISSDFRRIIHRIKDFNNENEIIIKTDRRLPIAKLLDPNKKKDIIKSYLIAS